MPIISNTYSISTISFNRLRDFLSLNAEKASLREDASRGRGITYVYHYHGSTVHLDFSPQRVLLEIINEDKTRAESVYRALDALFCG